MADTQAPLEELEDHERRVLGHLPAYRSAAEYDRLDAEKQADHVAHFEANRTDPDDTDPGQVAPLVRSYTLDELVERLDDDPYTPLGADLAGEVDGVLDDLRVRGLCETDGTQWSMTAAGLAALTTGSED